MNDKELKDTLVYCQNKLIAIKEVLVEMGMWEVVEKKAEELE